jgi:IMP dehydrogenase/GMP reductase
MNEAITFEDVLIKPKFSLVESRKDVDLSFNGSGFPCMSLPIISSNMDSVTGVNMASAMIIGGAQACLHRFQSIEDNVQMFLDSRVGGTGGYSAPLVSIGLGEKELERADALINVGALSLVVDVANGASIGVVKQVKELRKLFGNSIFITVGNFATGDSVKTFLEHEGNVDGIKVGVGPGSRCLTRVATGIGYPQLSAIIEISQLLKRTNLTIIADGGMNRIGDCAKALGAGAHLLMSGSFFAGTEEAPGETVWEYEGQYISYDEFIEGFKNGYSKELTPFKKYRGSASKESYEVQGKVAQHRTAEGDTTYIPLKGSVASVLQEIEGGLRSAFSYTNSMTLKEFHKNVEFVRVSSNTVAENGSRNKK